MPTLTKEEIHKIKLDTPIQVGKRVKQIREQKGISQTQLGYWTESDRQYVYKIESGKVAVSISKLAIIAKSLDVPLSKLVEID